MCLLAERRRLRRCKAELLQADALRAATFQLGSFRCFFCSGSTFSEIQTGDMADLKSNEVHPVTMDRHRSDFVAMDRPSAFSVENPATAMRLGSSENIRDNQSNAGYISQLHPPPSDREVMLEDSGERGDHQVTVVESPAAPRDRMPEYNSMQAVHLSSMQSEAESLYPENPFQEALKGWLQSYASSKASFSGVSLGRVFEH